MKNIILTMSIVLTLGGLRAYAQTSDRPVNVTVFGGISAYAGDHGNGFYDLDFGGTDNKKNMDNNRVFGGAIHWYLNRHIDLGIMGTYGSLAYYNNGERFFKDYLTTGNVQVKYKFGLPDNSLLKPYVFAGTGVTNHDGKSTTQGLEWMPITAGLGLNVQITEIISVQYQAAYGYWSEDSHDFLSGGNYNDAHLFNTLGVGFNLGSLKDNDKDRVPDKRDKCPATPVGIKVNKDGCPVDSDFDGVPDYLDKCAALPGAPATSGCPDADKDGVGDQEDQCVNEAGPVALKGCPDADADGIIDSRDKCPNLAGVAAFEGCPDRDGDGIQDSEDKCPDAKGIAFFNGCPDTDGDEIEDSKDMCPDKKGPALTNGCPDTDNDQVHDGIDKCPNTFGSAANNGCPELKKETKALFRKALQGIQFETGKAVIKPVSYPILNSIVKVMKDNPTYKLNIGGHTDNVGADEVNQTLSQNRAESVAKYLISKGVDPMRVTATGYGELKPVDTNNSAAGRARNRRVELSVDFIETVK